MITELKQIDLSKRESEKKFVVVFREHLFVLDDDSKTSKLIRVFKTHPALKDVKLGKEHDVYELLIRLADAAPDILVGEWYPTRNGLVIWNLQEIIPHTSIQAKKVAKQLGVNTVTYRNNDTIGNGDIIDKDISVKKLKGEIPKIMFHGTSARELTSLLKYGLCPYGLQPGNNDQRSNFSKKNIWHPSHVFVTATFEAAQYYDDNATQKDNFSFPIIIELNLPDPNKLVPDFDADSTVGAKSYYFHKVPSPTPTIMKAMGVSRETGKWGYKGRIPSSFFRWIHYYNPYHKKWHKSNPKVWKRLLDNYDLETISYKLGVYGDKEDNPKHTSFWS